MRNAGMDFDEIKKNILDRRLIANLLKYLKPYIWMVILSLIVLFLIAGIELVLPLITKSALDDFIIPNKQIYITQTQENKEQLEEILDEDSYYISSYNGTISFIIDSQEVKRVQKLFPEKMSGYKIDKELFYVVPYNTRNIQIITDNKLEQTLTEISDEHLALPYSAVKNLSAADILNLNKQIDYKLLGKRNIVINFWILGLIYLSFISLRFVFQFLQTYMTRYFSQHAMNDLRTDLYRHLQKMPTSFFDKNPVGRLVTRVTNDIRSIDEMLAAGVITIVQDVIMIVIIIAIMLTLNWELALISFITIPFVIILINIFKKKTRKIYRVVRKKLAALNATLAEHMSGVKIINLFNQRDIKMAHFDQLNQEYFETNYSQLKLFAFFRPIIHVMSQVSVALILWYGGGQILDGIITIGTFTAFTFYVTRLFQPINEFSEKFNILQGAMAGAERIFDLMEDEQDDYRDELTLNKIFDGKIEFRNVWLAYNPDEWVLKDVSFTINPGEKVALVGHTGSGKTSIVNLILGMYPYQKGDILIDGKPLTSYSLHDIRQNIGIVQQDVFLFSGTIKDNILLNNENLDDNRMIEVAKHVNVDTFIQQLPGKYYEPVMERGSTFSVGQRQLIAFARVLAYNPSIFILDEATSNIDTETEILIQDALQKIMENRTSIIIAHRLSTIQHSDRIIVLHKGKIIEEGNHQELLRKEGLYYDLYRLQYS
ncbi:ABC transporter ATP-binding protein [bacterium]|nr:ABC transporter ATP-binding protein [bacterium]